MERQRSGRRRAPLTVLGAMGLVALVAVLLRWPSLGLAVVPVALFLGFRRFHRVSSIGSAVVALLSTLLGVSLAVAWVRSYHGMDVYTWRSTAGRADIYIMQGSMLGDLKPYSGINWIGSLGLSHENYYLMAGYPENADHLLKTPLISPEVGDEDDGGAWGKFGWFKRWNSFWGGLTVARFVVPLWYLVALAAAAPLGYSSQWRRSVQSGGRAEPQVSVRESV